MAEFLDRIKKMYGGSQNPVMYKIVKIPVRYDGLASVVCDTEIVWEYDDLCVRLFDLDVSEWEISERIASEVQNMYFGGIFNVVTIHMTRMIR